MVEFMSGLIIGFGLACIATCVSLYLAGRPKRNCDRFFSWSEAWRYWRANVATSDDTKAENEPFGEWLFSDVKGGRT